MTRAIVIPSDGTQPLRWADHENGDYKSMTELVFGSRDGGTYTASTVGTPEKHVTLFYDDEGLFRMETEKLPDIINLRAMELWGLLDNMGIFDFSVPLVGDYVVVGDADDEGYSMDAPEWVMGHKFTWHEKYLVVEKEEGTDNAG